MNKTTEMKRRMQEEAVKAASAQVQEVWRVSEQQREAGNIPYHPQLNLRVSFEPKFDGGYDVELRPVALNADEAKRTGSDRWDFERGCWLIRGWKPQSDYGTAAPVAEEAALAKE